MKKTGCLLLLMVLSTALVYSGGQTEGGAAAKPEKTTISVWDWSTSQTPVVDEQIEVFQQKYPDIEIERQAITSNGGVYWKRLMTAIQADDLPDVAALRYERLSDLIPSGKFVPIQDYYNESDLKGQMLESAIDLFYYEGDLYGISTILYHVTVLANEGVFQKHNVELPKTWNDLLSACRTFKDNGVHGILMGGNKAVYIAIWFENLAAINGGEVYKLYDGKFNFAIPENIEAMEFLGKLAPYMNPDWATADNDDQKAALAQGQGATFLTGPWSIEPAIRINPDVKLKPLMMPYNGEIKGKTYVGGTTAYDITTSAEDRDAAWTMIEWFTGKEGATIYTEGGYVSPNLAVPEDAYAFPVAAEWVQLSAKNTRPLPQYPNSGEVRSIVTDACIKVMLGQKTAKEALEEATEAANKSLE